MERITDNRVGMRTRYHRGTNPEKVRMNNYILFIWAKTGTEHGNEPLAQCKAGSS